MYEYENPVYISKNSHFFPCSLSLATLGGQLVVFQEAVTVANVPIDTGVTLSESRFYHLALTYTRQFSLMQIYVDGVQEWQAIRPDVSEAVNKPIMFVGRAQIFGSQFYFTGTLACMRIFNYDMESFEIQEEMKECDNFDELGV